MNTTQQDTNVILVPVSIEIGPDDKPIAVCQSPINVDVTSVIHFQLTTPDNYFTGLQISPQSEHFGPITIDASKQNMTVLDHCPTAATYNLVLGFVDAQERAFFHDPEVINSPR